MRPGFHGTFDCNSCTALQTIMVALRRHVTRHAPGHVQPNSSSIAEQNRTTHTCTAQRWLTRGTCQHTSTPVLLANRLCCWRSSLQSADLVSPKGENAM
jgi:hypothetical protein